MYQSHEAQSLQNQENLNANFGKTLQAGNLSNFGGNLAYFQRFLLGANA